tara:strand:- start:2617 stop:3423 length:807 start_codon:yes stop_codon:yes gene_type:complete
VSLLKSKDYKVYSKFLENLARKLTKYYYTELDKSFKVSNKLKGRGYDPVTTSDKAFEKFIRKEIKKRFPKHQVVGEEFGYKKTKSNFTWIIDPIDGTRSFVIGNPTWSNLVSLNYKKKPVLGLANFPKLNKFYFNSSDKISFVVDRGKKRKIKVNKKVLFKQIKLSAAFHGMLTLEKQKKIPRILKLMQFPCSDALSYTHLAEGKVDIVLQCGNKIWDIHPLIPIIEAAGGIVSTWKNSNAIKSGDIIASANKTIHTKMLKMLKPVVK